MKSLGSVVFCIGTYKSVTKKYNGMFTLMKNFADSWRVQNINVEIRLNIREHPKTDHVYCNFKYQSIICLIFCH